MISTVALFLTGWMRGFEWWLLPEFLRIRIGTLQPIATGIAIHVPKDFTTSADETHLLVHLMQIGLIRPNETLETFLALNATLDRGSMIHVETRDNLPSPWSDTLQSPRQSTELIKSLLLDYPRARSLLSEVVKNAAAPEVVASVWQTLKDRSRIAMLESRLEAFGALFRISSRVPITQRLEMRKDFLQLFNSTSVPRRNWPTDSMEPIGSERSIWPGEGIPWEEDALSAALSWSSQIKAETTLIPGNGVPETRTGVFSYLAQAFVCYDDEGLAGIFVQSPQSRQPINQSDWKRAPLHHPLEATPWQRARTLHLRKPELKWPDRTWLRPVK